MKNLLARLGLPVLIGFGLLSAAAAAGNKDASLNIQLNIKEGCSVNFEGGSQVISFGSFTNLDSPMDRPGSFSLKCTAGFNSARTISVSLNAGSAGADDTVNDRKLYLNGSAAQGQFMRFQVFRGANAGTIWGDGSHGTEPYIIQFSDTSLQERFPFIVRLERQDVSGLAVGTYSNILTAEVNWQS